MTGLAAGGLGRLGDPEACPAANSSVRARRAAARWPLMTALSIVAGRPVSIQSPARKNPGSAVRGRRARRLAGGQREGGAPLAHRRRRAAAGRGAAPGRAPPPARRAPRRRSPRCRGRRRWSAPLHTSDTRVASPGGEPAPVERPLERPPRQADERRVEHRPIEPQVDGDDRRRGAWPRRSGDRRLAVPAARRRRRRRRARATAPPRSTAPAAMRSPLNSHAARPGRRAKLTRAAAPARTLPPWRSTNRHGRIDEDVRQRPRRQDQRGVVGPRAEHPPDHLGERRRGGEVDRLVQRRHRQRLPQQLAEAGGLAVRDQPLAHRLAGAAAPRSSPRARASPSTDSRSAPGERRPAEHAGDQVPRAGQRRAAQLAEPARPVDHRDAQRRPGSTAGRRRRSGAGRPACRDSSRAGRAGRCPPSRRSPGRGWRRCGRRAPAGPRPRPPAPRPRPARWRRSGRRSRRRRRRRRPRSRRAGRRHRLDAGPHQGAGPGRGGDHRPLRARHPDHLREHVVAARARCAAGWRSRSRP